MNLSLAMKRCSTCGEELPLSSFYKRTSGSRDGRRSNCRTCERKRIDEYQARKRAEIGEEAWREKAAESVRRHRATDDGRRSSRLQVRAYKEAERRLRAAHRAEFDALYRIVRYELGLPIEESP